MGKQLRHDRLKEHIFKENCMLKATIFSYLITILESVESKEF